MVLSFYESFIEDFFGNQKETLDNLRMRDVEVNRFCLFLQRAANKQSYSQEIESRIVFGYSFNLEKVADEIERMWRFSIGNKVKTSVEVEEIINLSKKALESAFDFYYRGNIKLASEVYDLRNKVRKKLMGMKNSDPNVNRILRHANRIVEDVTDLSQLALMGKL